MCKVNGQEQNVDYIHCISHEAVQATFKPLEVTDTTISCNLVQSGLPKPRINHPWVKNGAKVIYSYEATDTDEISIFENEIVEVFEEGQFEFSCQN